MSAVALSSAWRRVRSTWDRLAIYLPVMLMGVMALGTYWLARNTPTFLGGSDTQRPPIHEPDYFMRGFSVRTFDGTGRLKSEVFGTVARHYPDTDTLEIDMPRIRSYDEGGSLTVATAATPTAPKCSCWTARWSRASRRPTPTCHAWSSAATSCTCS